MSSLDFTAALALFPELGDIAVPARDEIVGNARAAILIDRITRRVRGVAGDPASLSLLMRELPSMGCREVALREVAASADHQAALRLAGYAPKSERIIVSRSLVFSPRPQRTWTHRREAELGSEAFAALVYSAMEGSADPTLRMDCYARYAAITPPHFRENAWSALELDGRLAGVALPSPCGPRGIALSFFGLAPGLRGRGFATDALRSVLSRASAAGAHVARAEIDSLNLASQRTFFRAGFTTIGRVRSYTLTSTEHHHGI